MMKLIAAGVLFAVSHLLFRGIIGGLFPDADPHGVPMIALALQVAIAGTSLGIVMIAAIVKEKVKM